MNLASDLFLLLLNLSQMRNRKNITDLFLDSISASFAPRTFVYCDQEMAGDSWTFPIATRNASFGCIVLNQAEILSEEDRSILHNATQMLAVILERLDLEETLEKERLSIERLADDRLRELQSAMDQLRQSRNAYINLVEDLTREVSERRQAEESLRQFKTIFDTANYGAAIADMQGVLLYCNQYYAEVHGYEIHDLIGQSLLIHHSLEQHEHVKGLLDTIVCAGAFQAQEVWHRRKDGSLFPMLMTAALVSSDSGGPQFMAATAIDLTERKQLEEQLQQAQKMESVGRLAGGVAHDFNNMLSVILGHCELVLDRLGPSHEISTDLREIRNAAERSANLTRQLLAFARKQTVAPKVLDLNTTVEGMLKMLRRLIGEDIDLAWRPRSDLWPIRIDPSQIDQILANLCVNARDAIQGVGKITIETDNQTIDDAYCLTHLECVPGEYTRLAVSDDGKGMDRETLEHLFEPFFTTKEVGQGTGLGLATVYGIVKQNQGFLNVYSEPGQGTTFKIYLPRYIGLDGKREQTLGERAQQAIRGSETVLLVEDEPAILKMICRMLERHGYAVLSASTPGEAMRLAQECAGDIHLLVTDVVMPEMNGRDLARNLLSMYPRLKRLFISGYTADVIAHHGVLEPGVAFLHKPFTMQEMVSKLREVFEEG